MSFLLPKNLKRRINPKLYSPHAKAFENTSINAERWSIPDTTLIVARGLHLKRLHLFWVEHEGNLCGNVYFWISNEYIQDNHLGLLAEACRLNGENCEICLDIHDKQLGLPITEHKSIPLLAQRNPFGGVPIKCG